MHAERAFSAGLDRGNDKLRFLSAQGYRAEKELTLTRTLTTCSDGSNA